MARSGSRPARPLFLASGLLAVLYGAGSGFSMWTGLSRKQSRGMLHNKERLYPSNAIEVEEPEEPVVEKFVMPEHRVPYSLKLDAEHFPEGKYVNMGFVQAKIMHALENYESFVNHVDAKMMFLGKHHVHGRAIGEFVDEETKPEPDSHKGEVLAPYFLKVKVHMRNHRSFVISKPALHARPDFGEAVDHSIDVMRKGIREAKEKTIKLARKMRREGKIGAEESLDDDSVEDAMIALAVEQERMEALADRQRDALYRAVEAAGDKAEQEAAKRAAGAVSRRPRPLPLPRKRPRSRGIWFLASRACLACKVLGLFELGLLHRPGLQFQEARILPGRGRWLASSVDLFHCARERETLT